MECLVSGGPDEAALQVKLNTSVPHSARVWNYWLKGKDNFAADRELGEHIKTVFPDVEEIAHAARQFITRAVTYLVREAGISQFLDVGTGLPTADNTHEVAQRLDPTARVVYVDNDPLVLVHARALLTSSPEGVTEYIDADIRNPEAILAAAEKVLDFKRPVALMLMGIMGHVVDHDEAKTIVRQFVDVLPAGSYLALNDGTNVVNPAARNEATQMSIEAGSPYISRHPDEIAAYFEGLELVPPGVVSTPRWRPDGDDSEPAEVADFCGIGRKP
jgi:hypothetical protein